VTKKNKHSAENGGLECTQFEWFCREKYGMVQVAQPEVKTIPKKENVLESVMFQVTVLYLELGQNTAYRCVSWFYL
jgi:hypothetical protein